MLNFDPRVVKRSWASRRRLFVVLGVAALILVPTVGSTLAGSISINSDNTVEFGQGTVMTTGCDNSITITPTSTYDTNTSAFVLSDITVSGVNDTTCAGVFLMIKMYDSGGAVVPLCDSDDGLFVLLDTTFATDVSSSCAALASADSTGFVYTLDQLVAAESVNSLSIESSGTSTNATTSTTIEPLSCVGTDTSTSGLDTILTFVSLASCDWIVPNGVTSVRYLVVGGGGAGDQGICNLVNPRAGGGGEVLTGTTSVTGGSTVNITVGAGGTVGPKHMTYCDNSDPPLAISTSGSPSNFDSISADGGGTPDTTYTLSDLLLNKGGDSGNGHSGGNNSYNSCNNSPGSGGGAGGPGGNDCPNEYGTAGGIGVQSNITGATLGYGGGGGVEGWSQANGTVFPISVDGGSNGQSAARPHSGGGGVVAFPGGSGVVIVRFLTP